MKTLSASLEALEDPAIARKVAAAINELPPKMKQRLRYTWAFNARSAQMMPDHFPWKNDPASAKFRQVSDKGGVTEVDRRELAWFVWLILAGRGFGKTRAGSETVRMWQELAVKTGKPIRIALIGPTAGDARDVMVEGISGILQCSPPWNMPVYESSKRRVTWKDGTIATLFSAEEPERLRGPQHHVGWADELAAWGDAEAVWDMLMFGMRLVRTRVLGPQIVVTTTPKPVLGLVKIYRKASTFITSGSTHDNKANLADTFYDNVVDNYEGTRLGRQEISGELLLDVQGALWSASTIERGRVKESEVPPLVRIVVAVDPSISDKEGAECGIICAGVDADNHVYVLEDASMQATPIEWARRAMAVGTRRHADKIIGEANNGGEMVRTTLMMADPDDFANVKLVHASHGKIPRAEPVSALYERGRIHHVGLFKELEDQMVSYSPQQAGKMLADRMDALVWAVTELAVRDIQQVQRRGMFEGTRS